MNLYLCNRFYLILKLNNNTVNFLFMDYIKFMKMPLVLLFLLCLFPLGMSAQSTVKGIVNDESG